MDFYLKVLIYTFINLTANSSQKIIILWLIERIWCKARYFRRADLRSCLRSCAALQLYEVKEILLYGKLCKVYYNVMKQIYITELHDYYISALRTSVLRFGLLLLLISLKGYLDINIRYFWEAGQLKVNV